MPNTKSDDFTDGILSEFTWDRIGANIASGIISGAAGFVVGKLLENMFEKKQNLYNLFEKFADDIVSRVTINLQFELKAAIEKENMRELHVATNALSENYRYYNLSKDTSYLLAAEQGAISASAEAKSLGLAALGVYLVVMGIKMSIFRDKELNVLLPGEVNSGIEHVNMLQEKALEAARNAVGEPRHLGYIGKSEYTRVGDSYSVVIDGKAQIVNVSDSGEAGEMSPIFQYCEELRAERVGKVEDKIVGPSNKVVDEWKKIREKFSESSPID